MSSFSIWHGAILILVWVAWIVPLYRILGKAGFAQGWAFVALIPPLGMVLLWFVAFARWPTQEELASEASPDQVERRIPLRRGGPPPEEGE